MRRKVFGGLLAAAMATPLTLCLAAATPANAAVGDYFYDGKSPITTGCNNDARTIGTARVGPAGTSTVVKLRYSPRCRTVWARIDHASTRIPADRAGGSALIYREQDRAGLRCHTDRNTSCHTAMLYDGGFTSHATGINDTGFQIYRGQTRSF
jgi:Protein of unknown function (DUF2690)